MADDAQVSLARFPPSPLCVLAGWSQSICLHLEMNPISLSFPYFGIPRSITDFYRL